MRNIEPPHKKLYRAVFAGLGLLAVICLVLAIISSKAEAACYANSNLSLQECKYALR